MTDIIFYSKIDVWIAAVLLGGSLSLILLPLWEWRYNNDNSRRKKILITILTIPFALLLLLPLVNIKYILTDDQLTVHNGFYSIRISLVNIAKVTPTHNTVSSPALSLDRVKIQYVNADGNNSILISPKDKDVFYQALQKRDPNLKQDDNQTGLIRK